MTRKLKIASVALGLLLVASPGFAKEIKFKQFITSVPCAAQVRSQIPARLQDQVWLFSEDDGKGWEFRDTIAMKAYTIGWNDVPPRQAVLIEHPIFVTGGSIQRSVWDPAKNCAAETSKEPYAAPPISRLSPTGFSDDDLKELLKAHKWGVIFLASPHSPGLSGSWLKSVKTVVDKKGGHLTVILASSEILASNETGFTAPQLQLVRTNGGLAANDLRPLASREIYDRHLHGGPEAMIYLKGFLSNRVLEPHSLADTRKAIQRELDALESDLKSD